MNFRADSWKEAEARYGKIDVMRTATGKFLGGTWADSIHWLKKLELSVQERQFFINAFTKKPMKELWVNADMVEPLEAALTNLRQANCLQEIKTFDGCFNIREIRGVAGKMSTHSYALAIDLNASQNPLGAPSQWSQDFVKCFTSVGFIWGGDFKRVDAQHFQWAKF